MLTVSGASDKYFMTKNKELNMHYLPPQHTNHKTQQRIRRSDLRALKADIAAGCYNVTPGQIAEKIILAQLFLFNDYC